MQIIIIIQNMLKNRDQSVQQGNFKCSNKAMVEVRLWSIPTPQVFGAKFCHWVVWEFPTRTSLHPSAVCAVPRDLNI